MRARGPVALPFARNYTFKPCVMHIERLIKVTDASGNYLAHQPEGTRQTAAGPSRTQFTPIIILRILALVYYMIIIQLICVFSANKIAFTLILYQISLIKWPISARYTVCCCSATNPKNIKTKSIYTKSVWISLAVWFVVAGKPKN